MSYTTKTVLISCMYVCMHKTVECTDCWVLVHWSVLMMKWFVTKSFGVVELSRLLLYWIFKRSQKLFSQSQEPSGGCLAQQRTSTDSRKWTLLHCSFRFLPDSWNKYALVNDVSSNIFSCINCPSEWVVMLWSMQDRTSVMPRLKGS